MSCMICQGPAKKLPISQDAFKFKCPECGPYIIAGTLERSMGSRIFDVEKTRSVLEIARAEYDYPTLSTYNEDLLIFPS